MPFFLQITLTYHLILLNFYRYCIFNLHLVKLLDNDILIIKWSSTATHVFNYTQFKVEDNKKYILKIGINLINKISCNYVPYNLIKWKGKKNFIYTLILFIKIDTYIFTTFKLHTVSHKNLTIPKGILLYIFYLFYSTKTIL